jgi:nucleotide-binding universal stress UspA family protein
MNQQARPRSAQTQPLPGYASILLAVDSSDHSNRGIAEAVGLGAIWDSRLSAAHVYAARMHDMRFRQMEGGLPEQFREEQELERQRDVHDDLITRGLSIITDSYLDQVAEQSERQGIDVQRRSLEGKNYRELAGEANSGDYDLLVMGALGLGAVEGSRLGTVCQRVTRRSQIDTLVIKEPDRSIGEGPLAVAVDGSAKSFGGLLTALALGKAWGVPVKVISAFDPYYHYVAFNRIAGVLSEEAGKVFRFQEQEQLHEQIIDSGLARIYQGHLTVAAGIAEDHGVEVETHLLDGKPHDVIRRYLNELKPSLLILGKVGIHADPELDIGGNAEALLRDADCAVLLSQREHHPEVDRLAEITTSWTREAEARMERVPDFVRNMARMAILRYAQERGHTVITEGIVQEATAQLMPGYAQGAMQELVGAYDRGELKPKPPGLETLRWSEEAKALLLTVKDLSLRGNLSMRAEKKARTDAAQRVEAGHLRAFLDPDAASAAGTDADRATAAGDVTTSPALHWQAAALARLMRVPEGFMRDSSRQRIEQQARDQGCAEITLEIAEQALAQAREAMSAAQMPPADAQSACPFLQSGGSVTAVPDDDQRPDWTPAARAMLSQVPVGFCRDMTVKAAEAIAGRNGLEAIDQGFMEQVMQTFKAGSESADPGMPWEDAARQRIQRAPDMVRGMLMKEVEGWARRRGLETVNHQAVDAVKQTWADRGVFHLDPDDPRNSQEQT